MEEIKQDISEIKVGMARIEVSLEEHMRRTEIAEENIELLKKNMWIAYGVILAVASAVGFYLKIH